jgi:hypothetical protein
MLKPLIQRTRKRGFEEPIHLGPEVRRNVRGDWDGPVADPDQNGSNFGAGKRIASRQALERNDP